jgi:transcriptional regulator with XRE-family HTH domain
LNQENAQFKALVLSKGNNKSDIARKLGVSPTVIGQYIKGRQKPKADFFDKWQAVYNEDIKQMFTTNVPRETSQDGTAHKIKKPDESGHTEKYIAVLEKSVNLAEMIQHLSTRYDQLQSKIEEGLINQAQMQSFLLQISQHVGMKKQRRKQEFRKTEKKTDKTP